VNRLRRASPPTPGYLESKEGASTMAYRTFQIESLAAYEEYRARLAADPLGRENYDFAQANQFLRREDRTVLKLASGPHSGSIRHGAG